MVEQYHFNVFYSKEDGEYVGVCEEFSSVSWLETEPHMALNGIKAVIADIVEDMTANGEVLPLPRN